MIGILLKEKLIRDGHHVVMVTVALLLTVRTNIRQSGVHVRMARNATISIVQLIIHETVRTNVFTAVHVVNLVVPICTQTQTNPNLRMTMTDETTLIKHIIHQIYIFNQTKMN
jgi:hypothetical protein